MYTYICIHTQHTHTCVYTYICTHTQHTHTCVCVRARAYEVQCVSLYITAHTCEPLCVYGSVCSRCRPVSLAETSPGKLDVALLELQHSQVILRLDV